MNQQLDVFSIKIDTEGLKEFEQKLKTNERELDKYEKEVAELEKKLKDLEAAEKKDTRAIQETKTALQEAQNQVKQFSSSVETMKNTSNYSFLQLQKRLANIAKTGLKIAAIGVTVKKSLDFYEQGEQLEFLAEKTGIAVEKLQLLGNAAKKYGGTTEGIAGTIENLREQYRNANMGNLSGGAKEVFMRYGFTLSADPEETLRRVAARMETMKSDIQKWDLAKSLGIDEGTTRLLIQGQAKYNEELKKVNKYKLYSKEDIQRMRDYRQISSDIRMGIESINGAVYRMLLPSITAVAKRIRNITDFLSDHEGLVQGGALFLGIAGGLMGINKVVKLLTGSTKGLSLALNSLRLAGWAALITAIYYVVEDFVSFLQGKESLIGDLWKSWGYDLDMIRIGFERWGKEIERIWNNICSLFDKNKEWQGPQAEIDNLKDQSNEAIQKMQKLKRKQEVKQLNEELQGRDVSISSANHSIFNSIAKWNAQRKYLKKGKETLVQYNNNRLNAVPAGAISNYYQTQSMNENRNQNTQTINNNNNKNSETIKNHTVTYNGVTINIKSNDPKEAAKELQAAMADIDNARFN